MDPLDRCPICQTRLAPPAPLSADDTFHLDCPRCATFGIVGSAAHMFSARSPNPQQVANASGWISENQRTLLSSADIPKLLTLRTPSVAERAEKLLGWLEGAQGGIGRSVEIENDSPCWLARSWSAGLEDLHYLLNAFLRDTEGWVNNPTGLRYQVTPDGHAHLAELRRGAGMGTQGFCAMWFDASVKPAWTEAIERAIEGAGYAAASSS